MATERKESRNRRKSSLCWQMWRIAIHLSSKKLFRMGSKYTYQKSQPESTCFKEEAVTKKFLFQVSISRQNQFQSRQCEQRMWKFCFLALSSISSDTLSIARSIPILSSRRLYFTQKKRIQPSNLDSISRNWIDWHTAHLAFASPIYLSQLS